MSFAVPSPIPLISCNHAVIMVLLILKKFYAEKTYIFFLIPVLFLATAVSSMTMFQFVHLIDGHLGCFQFGAIKRFSNWAMVVHL